MTYGQLDNELRRLLAPLEEGRREGRILLEEICAIPAGQFPLWQEREIPPELEDRCRSLARRRLEGEPLQEKPVSMAIRDVAEGKLREEQAQEQ